MQCVSRNEINKVRVRQHNMQSKQVSIVSQAIRVVHSHHAVGSRTACAGAHTKTIFHPDTARAKQRRPISGAAQLKINRSCAARQ
jgi:S-adenosylmethionine:tRNA-ribosyltransferase-isomerase (queuine synthetase)